MPSNFTENYQLSQWEATDQVQRADFNADNAKIDAAIKAVEGAIPQIAVGTYTGDGEAEQVIPLPFTPKALYLFTAGGRTSSDGNVGDCYLGGLALDGEPIAENGYLIAEIVEGGFKVFYQVDSRNPSYVHYYGANPNNRKYYYMALKW